MERNLRDLESIIDLKGCLLISHPDGEIIASTLVAELKKEIISEIFNVEDTFQRFSDYLEMGLLKDFVLDGPNGLVIIKRIIDPSSNRILFFIGIGDQNLHLPLVKIALIDFSKKIIEKMG